MISLQTFHTEPLIVWGVKFKYCININDLNINYQAQTGYRLQKEQQNNNREQDVNWPEKKLSTARSVLSW